MDDISAALSEKLIAYAARHGAPAARAMAKPWRLTIAQIDTFCRENSVAIKRARIALTGRSTDSQPRRP